MGGDFLCIPVAEIAMFEDLNPPRTHSGSAALRGPSTSLSRRFPGLWTGRPGGDCPWTEAVQVPTRQGSGARPAGDRWQPPRLTVFVSVPISSAGRCIARRFQESPRRNSLSADAGGGIGRRRRARGAAGGGRGASAGSRGARTPSSPAAAALPEVRGGQGRSRSAPPFVRTCGSGAGGGRGGRRGGEVLPLERRFAIIPGLISPIAGDWRVFN